MTTQTFIQLKKKKVNILSPERLLRKNENHKIPMLSNSKNCSRTKLKNKKLVLAGVAQCIECQPVNTKVPD